MKHLEDEDIARMIEEKISKKERKKFLKHLSECDACLTVYSETFKFVEKEKKRSTILRLPIIEKIKIPTKHLWQDIRAIFSNRIFRPAFAALMILLLMVPLVLKKVHDKKIENAKIQQIAMDIENMGSHAFSPAKDEIYAAVRAGIFVEDILLLVNTAGEEKLRVKISKMLNDELKTMFKSEAVSLFKDLENTGKLSELFGFGRFVEHSILSFTENKIPNHEDIDKYQRIIQKYKNKLPRGIFNQLKKLKPTDGIKESKKVFIAVKEIILSL